MKRSSVRFRQAAPRFSPLARPRGSLARPAQPPALRWRPSATKCARLPHSALLRGAHAHTFDWGRRRIAQFVGVGIEQPAAYGQVRRLPLRCRRQGACDILSGRSALKGAVELHADLEWARYPADVRRAHSHRRWASRRM